MMAGCSGEPSASDIDKVLKADAAGSGAVVHEVRKIGCAPAQGSAGYMCDVEVDATVKLPFVGAIRNKNTSKIRFFDDGGTWRASVN